MSASRANAARRFFADAIHDYGIREGDRVRIPMRQCELARRSNVASSTVGAYLSAMGTTIVARHPEIILDLQEHPKPPDDGSPEPVPTVHSVMEVIAELLEVQARLLRTVGLLPESAVAGRDRDPREPRGSARKPRGSGLSQAEEKEEKTPSSPSRPENRDGHARNRAESARIHDDPRGSSPSSGTGTAFDVVLEPLHDLARRRSLQPMNNRRGVVDALERYTYDEVASAVGRIVALCEDQQRPVRSPFGLLVGWARSGEREHFTPFAAPPEDAGGLEDELPVDEPFDAVVIAEIAAMEADPASYAEELRCLDEQIASDNHTCIRTDFPQRCDGRCASKSLRDAARCPHAHRGYNLRQQALGHRKHTPRSPTAHLRATLRSPRLR